MFLRFSKPECFFGILRKTLCENSFSEHKFSKIYFGRFFWLENWKVFRNIHKEKNFTNAVQWWRASRSEVRLDFVSRPVAIYFSKFFCLVSEVFFVFRSIRDLSE